MDLSHLGFRVFLTLSFVLLPLFSTLGANEPSDSAQSSNHFAIELYRNGVAKKGNFLFSPYSLRTALMMAYAGSQGPTAQEMEKTLGLKSGGVAAQQDIQKLNQLVTKLPRPGLYELSVANALWGQKAYPFEMTFLSLIKRYFGIELTPINFKETEQAQVTINEWAREKTKGKITNLIPSGVLEPTARLVLTNAIYLKASWNFPFNERLTKEEEFFITEKRKVRAPFLSQAASFSYFETEDFQLLDLPYQSNDLSMVVLLPKKMESLNKLEQEIREKKFEAWLTQCRKQKVQVSLPKFKFNSFFSASEALKKMGMKQAFDPSRANFSGISKAAGKVEAPLFLSAVLHKAFIEVDEKGTEAAAATAVTMFGASLDLPSKPKVFKADHPFLFFIRHSRSGAILFLGRLENPKA